MDLYGSLHDMIDSDIRNYGDHIFDNDIACSPGGSHLEPMTPGLAMDCIDSTLDSELSNDGKNNWMDGSMFSFGADFDSIGGLLVNPQTALPVSLSESLMMTSPITVPSSSADSDISPDVNDSSPIDSSTNITVSLPIQIIDTRSLTEMAEMPSQVNLTVDVPTPSPVSHSLTTQQAQQILALHEADINENGDSPKPKSKSKSKSNQQISNENAYPKPAYSYSCLIAMALKNSKTGSLPVNEIYDFMTSVFPLIRQKSDIVLGLATQFYAALPQVCGNPASVPMGDKLAIFNVRQAGGDNPVAPTDCFAVVFIIFIRENFPYFKTAPNGWKNSVRHNLSLNKCFEKIEKPSGNSAQRKGYLWAMNPAKVEKMEEELQKWGSKDPAAIRKSMANPERLELIEKGELKNTESESDVESMSASQMEPETIDVKIERVESVKTQTTATTMSNDLLNNDFSSISDSCLPELDLQKGLWEDLCGERLSFLSDSPINSLSPKNSETMDDDDSLESAPSYKRSYIQNSHVFSKCAQRASSSSSNNNRLSHSSLRSGTDQGTTCDA